MARHWHLATGLVAVLALAIATRAQAPAPKGAELPAQAPAELPAQAPSEAAAAAALDAAVQAPAPPYVSFQAAAPPSGILTYNPNGTVLNGAGFSAFLVASQKQSAVTGVQLQAGTYTVKPYSGDAHIYFQCTTRTSAFLVNLAGCTLLYTDGTIPGVTLDACQGVTLQGPATLTYLQAQTPYAQMTILSVDPTSTYFQMQIHADYVATWQRILNQFGGTVAAGVVYSQNTRKILPPWRGGTNFGVLPQSIIQITANIYNLTVAYDPGVVYVGDQVVLKQPTLSTGIGMYNAKNNMLVNLVLPTAAGFGIYDGTPTGTNYITNVQLAPPNVPGSDGNYPLMSSIFDGFHSTSGIAGFQIANCTISSTGDDMIAIHGRMYTVGAIASPNITVGAYTSDLTVGDTIMLYSNVGKPTGSAVIKTIVSVPIPPGIDPNSYDSVFGNQFGGYAWWRLQLQSFPSAFAKAPFNSFITDPTRSGNGYSIVNSLISNGRGCGARVRGSNAVIQNNTINYVALDSYNAAPGFDGSMEGGFAQNVTLNKNYIESYGSAFLLGSNTNAQTPFNYANSNSINISTNTIVNSQFGVLTLESGGTIMMMNNKFTNVMCSAGTQNTRSFSWQVPYTPVQVTGVSGITFTGNTFTNTSACAQPLANLNQPYYLVNTTGVVGVVKTAPITPYYITANVKLWVYVISVVGGEAAGQPPAAATQLSPPLSKAFLSQLLGAAGTAILANIP